MLSKQVVIETVTFSSDPAEGYAIPEVSGFGSRITCEITHTHDEEIDESITIKIGDNKFRLDTLQYLIDQVDAYRAAAKAFVEAEQIIKG